MRIPWIAAALWLSALSTCAHPVFAQSPPGGPPCAGIAQMLDGLAQKFHEAPVGAGIVDGPFGLLLVTAGPDGSFSILRIQQDRACLVGSGTGWHSAAQHQDDEKPPDGGA